MVIPPKLPAKLSADVSTAAAQLRFAAEFATFLANPCRNGPIYVPGQVPPANEGWIFITQPQSSSQPLSAIQANPPPNAPGGEPQSGQAGNCSAINPASQNAALQITVRYNFVPLTPFVRQFTANSIILTAYTVYRTEY